MFLPAWSNDEGQDVAEYAVMLAVILVIVIGTIRLIGGRANNVFSTVASEIHQRDTLDSLLTLVNFDVKQVSR